MLSKLLTESQLNNIGSKLTELVFEILSDKNKKLVGKTKSALIDQVQKEEVEEHFSLGDFLPKKLNKEYAR